MSKKMSKKGQIVIIDLFMAFFIFVILIMGVMFAWGAFSLKLTEKLEKEEMVIKAFQVSDLLVKNPGKPTEWEKGEGENIEVLGLANMDRNLSTAKIDQFTNLDYGEIKNIFDLRYDFYFKVTDINGNKLKEKGKVFSNKLGSSVVNVKRYVIFENEKAIVEFTLWK